MLIYRIGPGGYLDGVSGANDGSAVIPRGYTRTAPPDVPDGQYARWAGDGWVITEQPYEPPPAPPDPTGLMLAVFDADHGLGRERAREIAREYQELIPALTSWSDRAAEVVRGAVAEMAASEYITPSEHALLLGLMEHYGIPEVELGGGA